MDRGAVADLTTIHVARLAGNPVTLAEFLRYLCVTGRLNTVTAVLGDLLVRQLAIARGLSVPDAELQGAVDSFRRQHRLYRATEMNQWLANQQLSVDDLAERIELSLLRVRLKDLVCGAVEIERHFAENRRTYDQARLAQIVVAEPGIADELKLQIDEGGDFAVLAARYSNDESTRHQGGELGLVSRTSLCPVVESAVFSARPGEVVGPVHSDAGWHLLKVHQILTAKLDEPLSRQIGEHLFQHWLAQQLAMAGAEVTIPRSP